MDNFTLASLIRRVANGDLESLEKIFYEMKDNIFSFVLMYANDRQLAEDILQETMLQLVNSCKNFKRSENPKAWILTIARNNTVSYLRKTNRETNLTENITETLQDNSQENDMADNLNAQSILSSLTIEQREVVVLHVISGLKHKEIAKLLNVPLGTICWRYNESIKKLKQFTYNRVKEKLI